MKYFIAFFIEFGFSLLIFLDKTNEECKYKLWGIIMQPTNPVKAVKEPLGIVGTNVPYNIYP